MTDKRDFRARICLDLAVLLCGLVFVSADGQKVLAESPAKTPQCQCSCPAAASEPPISGDENTAPGNGTAQSDVPPAVPTGDETLAAAPEAAAPPLRFSELFPDPVGSDTAGEFIEIHNVSASDVDSTGWKVADQSGETRTLPATMIGAGAHYSFVYAETKFQLVNAGMTITLLDPFDRTADSVSYPGPAKEGQTYAKNDSGLWAWTDIPTPGSANQFSVARSAVQATVSPASPDADGSSATPSIQPAAASTSPAPDETTTLPSPAGLEVPPQMIVINEFLPNPLGDDSGEWIELFNPGSAAFPLTGWSIDDADGGSRPYSFAASDAVAANGYFVIAKTTDKLALNNDADSVRLIDPTGRTAETVSYVDPPEGRSFARYPDGWRWSDLPSPGQENVVGAAAEPSDETAAPAAGGPADGSAPATVPIGADASADEMAVPASIQELPDLEEGSLVRTEGIVSLPLGATAKTILAVQDEDATAGVLVRLSGSELPAPKIGQRIGILGRLRSSRGETVISARASDLTPLSAGDLRRSEMTLAEAAETASGVSVSTVGTVTGKGKNWLKIADEAGEHETKVLLPPAVAGAAKVGAGVRVSAVVKRRNSAAELIVLDRSGLAVTDAPASAAKPETPPASAPSAQEPPVHLTVSASRVPYAAYGFAAAALGACAIGLAVWRKRQTAALED